MLHVDIRNPSARDSVLFLHAGGFTVRMWDGIQDRFDDFRTVAVDLPGHGESRAAPFTTIEAAADATAEAIRENLNGPAHVVGLSLGAYVGFSLAQRHPALVDRAVLSGFQVTRLKGAFWLGLFVNLLSPFPDICGAKTNAPSVSPTAVPCPHGASPLQSAQRRFAP